MDELHKAMEAKAAKELERCCAEELRGYKDVEYRLLKGVPPEEILKFKRDNNIDMIILGTSGSIAARRPVLIMAPREEMLESMSPKLSSEGKEIRL